MPNNSFSFTPYPISSSKIRSNGYLKHKYHNAESSAHLEATTSNMSTKCVYATNPPKHRSHISSHTPTRDRVKLTKREKECLKWASEGKTSYEIATILGLSENTINNYVASIVRKMGASNRLHMVGIALRENYID